MPSRIATRPGNRFSASGPTNALKPCTGLTFSRGWLIRISKETLQIAKDGKYYNRRGESVDISKELQFSMQNSVHYHSSHIFEPSKTTVPRFESTEFCVCFGTSLQVATKLQDELDQVYEYVSSCVKLSLLQIFHVSDTSKILPVMPGSLNAHNSKPLSGWWRCTVGRQV